MSAAVATTRHVTIAMAGGAVNGVLHVPAGSASASRGVLLVSGAGGGVLGPGHIYEDVATTLASKGIVTLRLNYRTPNHTERCIADVAAATKHVRDEFGVRHIGITGWSFGGAVALRAAEEVADVKACATIASQTAGIGPVASIGAAGKALLLMHGTADTCLSAACSEIIYGRAKEPKQLRLFEGDDHGLTHNSAAVKEELVAFFVRSLPLE